MHFHLYCVFSILFSIILYLMIENAKKEKYFETTPSCVLKVRKTPSLALFKGKMITGMTPKNFWSL